MLQLAYMSSPTEAMPDVKGLSDRAAARNVLEEITGGLMLCGGRYLQVLEGPKEVVEDAFLRIIGDDRHNQLYLLSRNMVTARQFGSRSMCMAITTFDQQTIIDQIRATMSNTTHELRILFESMFGRRIESS